MRETYARFIARAARGLRSGLTAIATCVAIVNCSTPSVSAAGKESPYLLIFAGNEDKAGSDFLAVVDVRPDSPNRGKVVATTPTGMAGSLPHHMEYALPPDGELLFMNAHHHEMSMLVDVSNPRAPRIAKTFTPPPPLRFPHDYTRTPSGTRLVGFLRSEGKSIDPKESETPGNYGGIAEYSADGVLLRTAMAGNAGSEPVRPYAFALLPAIDRLVVTSAPMMETTSADAVQVYRYSDFKLLKTIELPAGKLADGRVMEGSQAAGFGPRVLADGSVFLNSYGCTFYRLSEIGSDNPHLETLFALETPAPRKPGSMRGSCGIPVVFGRYWINPIGQLHAVLVLDISNPSTPREVFRLPTPSNFNPHWLARDPRSNRLVLGAELGGEEGFYILRFDEKSGRLSVDSTLAGEGQAGYVSLRTQVWPPGTTGPAWGHAALFLPDTNQARKP